METAVTNQWWKRPVVVDAVVVVVLATMLTILVSVASEPGSREVNAVPYIVVGLLAAIQMLRRQRPVLILILSFALNFVYHALDYPAIGNLPLAVPLFTAPSWGTPSLSSSPPSASSGPSGGCWPVSHSRSSSASASWPGKRRSWWP